MASAARLTAEAVAGLSSAPVGVRSPHFTCRGRAGAAPLRLAVVAPKRVWKLATKRNRVRRRVREAFRVAVSAARAPLRGEILVSCLAPAAGAPFSVLVGAAAAAIAV
ncbi:MAG TPA: ribonuclease P protein component, partial [Candidatus Paceibacterota bacterium]